MPNQSGRANGLIVVVVFGIVVDVVVGTDVVVGANEAEVVESVNVDALTGSEVCPEHAETAIRATTQARPRMGRR
ncbi:MAG TPA: hypothetical protein VF148_05480 [Acidimicrobiia bacterium]